MDSRDLTAETEDIPIQCVTVHKAKGLEYGHVILPFCSFPIDYIKRSQLHISTEKADGRLKIGYSLTAGDEARVLYVAMTRAIRSFSWIDLQGRRGLSWQSLINGEE